MSRRPDQRVHASEIAIFESFQELDLKWAGSFAIRLEMSCALMTGAWWLSAPNLTHVPTNFFPGKLF